MKRLSPALYYQIFDIRPGRGEERKLKILEAFISQVASRGLDNISFETLGKATKMQRTHITYYFANREELIRASVRYATAVAQRNTIAHVEKARDWKGRLKAVVEGPFYWLEEFPEHASVMAMFYYLCSYDTKYRDLQNSIRQMGEERIANCLEPLFITGKITSRRATELARAIQNQIAGALHNYYSSDYPLSLKQLREQTVAIVQEWL